MSALIGGIALFIANESKETSPISTEALEAKITSSTRGRLYTNRNKSCEAFFVCQDVVAVSGVCLGSDVSDTRSLQFKALPLGDAPQAAGVRTEYYLSKLSIHDLALIKLDRVYENVKPEWSSRLPSDGFDSRRWVETKAKQLCAHRAKQLYVQVYPGDPGEVTGHLPKSSSQFLVDCPGSSDARDSRCRNNVMHNDQVTLIAKTPNTRTVEFDRWEAFSNSECPCAKERSKTAQCTFDVSATLGSNLGCIAVYKGPGIDSPVSLPALPTASDLVVSRPITASFPGGRMPGMEEPGRYVGLGNPALEEEAENNQ